MPGLETAGSVRRKFPHRQHRARVPGIGPGSKPVALSLPADGPGKLRRTAFDPTWGFQRWLERQHVLPAPLQTVDFGGRTARSRRLRQTARDHVRVAGRFDRVHNADTREKLPPSVDVAKHAGPERVAPGRAEPEIVP